MKGIFLKINHDIISNKYILGAIGLQKKPKIYIFADLKKQFTRDIAKLKLFVLVNSNFAIQ